MHFGFVEVAELLGGRGAKRDLRFAAGLGELDVVKSWFDADGSLKPGAGALADPYGQELKQRGQSPFRCERTRPNILSQALCFACVHNRLEVADFLLAQGADINAIVPGLDMKATVLHRVATADGRFTRSQIETAIRFLLDRGADPAIPRRDDRVNIIASVPAPKPSPRVVGSSDREPNWRARTGGRHNGRTPTPSRVCSSSSTRVAKPSRRQAGVGWPLVGVVANHLVRHIPDRNKPAAVRRRDNPAIAQDWDRRVVDIVVQPPAASRLLASTETAIIETPRRSRAAAAGRASILGISRCVGCRDCGRPAR